MQDYVAALTSPRKDAADAAAVRDCATDAAKRELFDKLQQHLDRLADEIERVFNAPKPG